MSDFRESRYLNPQPNPWSPKAQREKPPTGVQEGVSYPPSSRREPHPWSKAARNRDY